MPLKAFHAILFSASFCLLLAGCGSRSQRADLVLLNGAEPETLDPALITGQPEGRVANALFEGLTSFDPAGKPIPGVAESWKSCRSSSTRTAALW